MKIIISCEHATNSIPEAYKKAFKHAAARLKTHEGYDIGALNIAKLIAEKADFFLQASSSRLLIDFNRSLHNASVFSNISRTFNRSEKNEIITHYYQPYRAAIQSQISKWLATNETVIHLSVHSFTPVLDDEVRHADIGLLYDPKRLTEKKFCQAWADLLIDIKPQLQVRKNYPYAGTADGFCTFLRKMFPERYLGIELEVNQKLLVRKKKAEAIADLLNTSFYTTKETY